MLGRVIAGRFTVLSCIGEGAMGTVYRAKQSPIGREVAVKILRADRALDETSRARFLREARANSVLTSPNTVTVFDFGEGESGEFYLAMELLEGESLGQRLKRMGRLDPAAAIDTARQALRSLAEAHAKGIIHRDLKPDNLFYARVRSNETYEEIVKVLDFGIAKMLRADDELAMNAIETQAGTVFGTPRYMSPEQAQGKPLDPRSDLYSLGVILYQMLTGRPPFTDDDAIVVMARHIKTTPRPMNEATPDAHVPPEIESAVMRVLSKEPGHRPQTADAMAAELSRARESALSVTSGVRASLPVPPDVKVEEAGRAASASETFDEEERALPRSKGRWLVPIVALLAAAAAIGVGMRFFHDPEVAPAAAAALAPRPAAVEAPSATAGPSEPSPTGPTSAEKALPPPPPMRATDLHIAPPSGRTVPTAPSSAADAHPPPRHHAAAPAPKGNGAPASAPSSSVGYGYLE